MALRLSHAASIISRCSQSTISCNLPLNKVFKLKLSVLHNGSSRNLSEFKVNEFKGNQNLFHSEHEGALQQVSNSMSVIENFITEVEENQLLEEVNNILKRIRYEKSHWDDAIHNYRETEHLHWKTNNQLIIDKVRQIAFSQNDDQIKFVHILDIAKDGYIKPHVDSVRVFNSNPKCTS